MNTIAVPANVERNQRLLSIMERWVAFTGVDLDQSMFTIKMDGSLNDHDIKRNYERVQAAIKLDGSGVLPIICFRTFFNNYCRQTKISAEDMLDPEKSVEAMARLTEMRAIREESDNPIFTEPIQALKENIRAAAVHYECDEKVVQNAISDEEHLEEAIFMAFKGTDSMPEDWFSKGEYDSEPPQLCKTILRFENDLQAISFAAQMPVPFIALAIVYDEYNPLFSHFMFLCKSGENVWMLHDKTDWEHPAQEELVSSRGGGLRFFENSKEYAWQFPYHLLDSLKKSDTSDTVVSEIPVSSLEPNNVAWLIMVFERIRLKYFDGKYEPKKITSVISEEPIVIQSALTTETKALVSAEGIKLLGDGETLPQVTTIQIQTDTIRPVTRDEIKQDAIEGDFQHGSTGQNKWLEDRYEDQIPDVIFNPNQLTEGDKKLLGSGNDKSEQKKNWDVRMGRFGSKFPVMSRNLPEGVPACKESFQHVRGDVRKMGEASVGDIEKLQKDARWHARYNKANMVQYLAWEEYYRRRDEVCLWFKKKVLEKRDHISQWASSGELISDSISNGGLVISGPHAGQLSGDVKDDNIVRGPFYCKSRWPHYQFTPSIRATGWLDRDLDYHECKCFCPVTGDVATIFAFVSPHTVDALTAALGIDKSELPDVLQNYSRENVYSGNHLLGNVDPMDWCVEDPWSLERFTIAVGFSRRGFKKLRKEQGLEPIKVEDMKVGDDHKEW